MKDHPALVASLLSAALIAARLLSIARFDVGTAATVLEVAGTGTAIAGTALSLLPFGLVVATCLLALRVFVDETFLQVGGGAGVLFGIVLAATVALVAVPLVVLTAVFVVAAALVGRATRKGGRTRIAEVVSSSRLLRVQMIVLVTVMVLAPIVLQRPWFPTQALRLDDGRVVVGYVLGDADGLLAVMRDRDRTVHLVDPEEVETREICFGTPAAGGTIGSLPRLSLGGPLLGALMWGDQTPDYEPCPDEREADPAG